MILPVEGKVADDLLEPNPFLQAMVIQSMIGTLSSSRHSISNAGLCYDIQA
jgi:hypothetical protein